jgi:hypothetical protein
LFKFSDSLPLLKAYSYTPTDMLAKLGAANCIARLGTNRCGGAPWAMLAVLIALLTNFAEPSGLPE